MASLEDVFLELCMQDGDLETAKIREEREERPAIVKKSTAKKLTSGQDDLKSNPLLSENNKKVQVNGERKSDFL